VALFTLIQKNLLTGKYADVVRDRALIPATPSNPDHPTEWHWSFPYSTNEAARVFVEGMWTDEDNYACPELSSTVDTLASNPGKASALLCLADFWRLNEFDNYYMSLPPTDAERLGGSSSEFPGEATSRAGIYARVLANPQTSARDTAYALYRSVMCYAPNGRSTCGGEVVPVQQRRAWFQRLKKDYASSYWAKDLRYYW
jgi:hypothetical protein